MSAASPARSGGLAAAVNDRPIATKLLTAMLLLTAIMVLVGVVGYRGMSQIGDRAEGIFRGTTVPIVEMAAVRNAFTTVRTGALDHAASSGAERQRAAEAAVPQNDAALE